MSVFLSTICCHFLHILIAQGFQVHKLFFFSSLSLQAVLQTVHSEPSTFGFIFFMPFPYFSLSCSSFTSIFNESFLPLCETHLHCSAEGKAVAGGEETCMNRLRRRSEKEKMRIKKSDLSFTKIMDGMSDRKTSLHASFGILY